MELILKNLLVEVSWIIRIKKKQHHAFNVHIRARRKESLHFEQNHFRWWNYQVCSSSQIFTRWQIFQTKSYLEEEIWFITNPIDRLRCVVLIRCSVLFLCLFNGAYWRCIEDEVKKDSQNGERGEKRRLEKEIWPGGLVWMMESLWVRRYVCSSICHENTFIYYMYIT